MWFIVGKTKINMKISTFNAENLCVECIDNIKRLEQTINEKRNQKIRFRAYPLDEPSASEPYQIPVDIPIPKSKWVEEILPHLNYKNVALVELPRVAAIVIEIVTIKSCSFFSCMSF